MEERVNSIFEDFERFLSKSKGSNISAYRDLIYSKVNRIANIIESSPNKEELKNQFFCICERFANSPLHQRVREKPLGYAGDYLIIDWIYTEKTIPSGKGKLFDLLFQSYEASQAVRNRKHYFVSKCIELSYEKASRIDILDIGCGPCRDVLETFQLSKNGKNLYFHCIDNEPKAIEYAKELLANTQAQDNITLSCENIFRLNTSQKYDLIWSAGLFDYLDNQVSVLLLKKSWKLLKDGGQIIFGNFSPKNPSRHMMELVGKWYLIHRSAKDLIQLCKKAKIPFSEIGVESEPLGINLFCIISK